jgi:cobalt-zinc-cadmium efflux system outer membrane protein
MKLKNYKNEGASMKARWFIILIAVVFLQFGYVNVLLTQDKTELVELQKLINEALQKNPDYLSAQKRWESAKAQIPQARALPDPSLGLAVANLPVNSFAFDQEPMTGKKILLMQMFPFPGKLGLKEDIADYQAQVVEQQVEELKNNLIKNVKLTYYNLFLIDKTIEIVEKNKTLLQQFVQVAETKYSVGKGLQQDVLKAQVELSKLSDKLISLQQKRNTFVFQFNKLLNRDIGSIVGKTAELNKSESQFTPDELHELGLKHRPLLKSWQLLIEKSKSANKLAKLDYLPDFSLGAAYTQRDDLSSGMKMYDFFSVELKVSLPLYFYKKQSKKAEETQLMINSIEDKYNSVKNEVLFQIEDTFTELDKNAKLIDLYKTGIIPQASQSLNSAMSGYQVDKVDFLTLLNNQMTLFNYEIEYYKVLVDHEKNLAELEAAVGKNLDFK